MKHQVYGFMIITGLIVNPKILLIHYDIVVYPECENGDRKRSCVLWQESLSKVQLYPGIPRDKNEIGET